MSQNDSIQAERAFLEARKLLKTEESKEQAEREEQEEKDQQEENKQEDGETATSPRAEQGDENKQPRHKGNSLYI